MTKLDVHHIVIVMYLVCLMEFRLRFLIYGSGRTDETEMTIMTSHTGGLNGHGPCDTRCLECNTNSRKIIGKIDFPYHFKKIIVRYKKIGYNINVMRQTACLVVNPIKVNSFAYLFNCTTVGRTSD